jgi:hypothetical protein
MTGSVFTHVRISPPESQPATFVSTSWTLTIASAPCDPH